MVLGLSLRVSWICLLFSSGACLPASKGDYRYPYAATWSSGGSPGSSSFQPGGSRRPLEQPARNRFPPSVGAPSYEPNSFVAYESASASAVPSQPARFGGSAPYGNPSSAGFPSWGAEPAGGVGAVFSDPRKWMPNRQFPDFGAWESNVGVPMSAGDSETSPLPPSSYIIQSMNGYEREREFLSHSKYSPEYPEPPPFPLDPVKAPSKLPRTVPKGGNRV